MANLTSIGVAISGGDIDSTRLKENAYDGNAATIWGSYQEQGNHGAINGIAWIGRNFGVAAKVNNLTVTQGGPEIYNSVTSIFIEYSADLINWTTIQKSSINNSPSSSMLTISDYPASKGFRIRANSAVQSISYYCWYIAEMSLTGTQENQGSIIGGVM